MLLILLTLLFNPAVYGISGDCMDTELLRVEHNTNSMMYQTNLFHMDLVHVYLPEIEKRLAINATTTIIPSRYRATPCFGSSVRDEDKLNRLITLRNATGAINYRFRKTLPSVRHRIMDIGRRLRNYPKCVEEEDTRCLNTEMTKLETIKSTTLSDIDKFLSDLSDTLLTAETLLGHVPPNYHQQSNGTEGVDCTTSPAGSVLHRIIQLKKGIHYKQHGYEQYMVYIMRRANNMVSMVRAQHEPSKRVVTI